MYCVSHLWHMYCFAILVYSWIIVRHGRSKIACNSWSRCDPRGIQWCKLWSDYRTNYREESIQVSQIVADTKTARTELQPGSTAKLLRVTRTASIKSVISNIFFTHTKTPLISFCKYKAKRPQTAVQKPTWDWQTMMSQVMQLKKEEWCYGRWTTLFKWSFSLVMSLQ